MYEFKRLSLSHLDQKTLDAYERFTPSQFACCLKSKAPHGHSSMVIAIGATIHGKPIGLILASLNRHLLSAEIHSLYIEENHRNKGVGSRLYKELEKVLKDCNCHHARFIYPGETATTPYLEKILHQHNWAEPRLLLLRYHFDAFNFNPPWLNQSFEFPADFVEFPWKELTARDRALIEHQDQQGRIPVSVYPFNQEEKLIENLNSLGLRYQGEVIGWMITHRISPDTIRYSALYIHKEFLFAKTWLKLLIDAINLQRHSSIQWAVIDINVTQVDHSWLSFVKRRLSPYAIAKEKEFQSWIDFQSTHKVDSLSASIFS